MCKPSHPPLGRRAQLQIAKLMQMHKETHPDRVGAFFGVGRHWAARLWNRFTAEEIRNIPDEEALGILARMRYGEAHLRNPQCSALEVIRAARQAIPHRGSESCPECTQSGVTTRLAGRKV